MTKEVLVEQNLIKLVNKAVQDNFPSVTLDELPTYLEIPKEYKFGDFSSTVALKLSKILKQPPLEIANILKSTIIATIDSSRLKDVIFKTEIQPPGFINFFIKTQYLYVLLNQIIQKGKDFARSDLGKGANVLIEFISANPTGPLSLAHGRQAAVGDALANILDFAGFNVSREYYVNDEGRQIDLLGASIEARLKELLGKTSAFPEEGYHGKYIYDISRVIIDKKIDTKDKGIEFFSKFGVDYILEIIKNDLEDFGVKFDFWSSQKALREDGNIDEALDFLAKKKLTYKEDDALWFKSTAFGDDKDRVVIKKDKTFTYLAPDIAYHRDKFRRGFNWLINLWGPDHHGYIQRLKAAIKALGHDKESLSVIIVQLVTLLRGKEAVSMSKRSGEFVSLRDVMTDVGKDVTRFFFLTRRTDSHLDFDLELAKKQSQENPVFYIQYAYARIWGILEGAKEKGISLGGKTKAGILDKEEEIIIMRLLNRFPHIILASYKLLDPYPLTSYLLELVGAFHRFYDRHKVLSEDTDLTSARLMLIEAVKIVLENGLTLLGVSRPKRM
ncbi:MAG: arginine--tRNA ligase [Candidatus Omnitrophota bacterium]